MRKMKPLSFLAALALSCVTATAQTMSIETSNVTTLMPAAQAGEMVWSNGGQTLTVGGASFDVADITRIAMTNEAVTDNTVNVVYNGSTAHVTMAGNVAQHLTTTVSGAHVTIVQDSYVTDEITYTLSGTSGAGSFTMDGELKATVVLNGVSLTSNVGAPIDIENGKRIDIVVNDGTVNTFSDAATGTQKACFFVNGHAEFSGAGTINITGNARHGYRSDEYTKLKESFTGTINVLQAAGDGMHVEQYLLMNNGNIVISNVTGDAIDIAMTNDATDEMNGQCFINGGTITATSTGDDVKTLKSDADMVITGGQLKLTATGAGSKAISTKGALTISGGVTEALSLGGIYNEGATDEAKPNAIKATGNLTISGGEVYVVAKNKAFNTDAQFYLNGGKVMGISDKANATVAAASTATKKVYTNQTVNAGATITRDGISYTVPTSYSCSKAVILVSPSTSSSRISDLDDNNVAVDWSGSSATVDVADNIADLVSVSVNGANVCLLADAAVADEITYTLSGTSSAGSFYMDGAYKSTLILNNLNLTSTDSAAVNIRNSKRIKVVLADGSTNTLSDASNGSQKGCMMVKGHTEFSGTGSLTLTGNTNHAFWGDEYVAVENGTITVKSAKQDGMNINQYFQQTGGTVTIGSVGDDGLSVAYDTDSNDARKTDTENTGEIIINGGTLNITASAAGSKGMKAEGKVTIDETAGTTTITVKNSGGTIANGSDYTGSSCLKSDEAIVINGGTVTLTNTGQGGKGMSCDGTVTIGGGTINARAEGNNYGSSSGGGWGGWGGSSSSSSKSAKGVKCDGAFTITDGQLTVYSKSHEGLESKSTMTFKGGTVNVQASDDAINSAGNMTIEGGTVYAYSTGNDGIDANGNMYLKGGMVAAFGAGGAESGFDVAEQRSLVITGGTIFGIGGRVDASPSGGTQAYISGGSSGMGGGGGRPGGGGSSSGSVSASSGAWFVVSQGNTRLFAVKVPAAYSGSVLASCSAMSSGTTYTIGSATSVSGTQTNGFIATPTVSSVSNATSFTAKK